MDDDDTLCFMLIVKYFLKFLFLTLFFVLNRTILKKGAIFFKLYLNNNIFLYLYFLELHPRIIKSQTKIIKISFDIKIIRVYFFFAEQLNV